jgi:hypothetical protein
VEVPHERGRRHDDDEQEEDDELAEEAAAAGLLRLGFGYRGPGCGRTGLAGGRRFPARRGRLARLAG